MENEKNIMECIMRLSRASRRSRGAKQLVTHGTFRVMKILDKQGVMRLGDLAEMLTIRLSSLAEKLAKMEEQEWIQREKDPSDARIVLVSLTEKGKAEMAASKLQHQETMVELQSVLTKEEQASFAEICDKLVTFFEGKESNHSCKRRTSI